MEDVEIPNWSRDDVILFNQPFDNGYLSTNSESVEEICNASSEISSTSPILDNINSCINDLFITDDSICNPEFSDINIPDVNYNEVTDILSTTMYNNESNTSLHSGAIKEMEEAIPCVEKKRKAKPRKKKEKQIFRHSWTMEEDFKLRMLVEKYKKKHWKLIAQELGTDRLETECRQHYVRVLERTSTKGRWNPDEVCRLKKGVVLYADWDEISDYVKTRDKFQCKTKWAQLCASNKRNVLIC